jgi:hypothetical protein
MAVLALDARQDRKLHQALLVQTDYDHVKMIVTNGAS